MMSKGKRKVSWLTNVRIGFRLKRLFKEIVSPVDMLMNTYLRDLQQDRHRLELLLVAHELTGIYLSNKDPVDVLLECYYFLDEGNNSVGKVFLKPYFEQLILKFKLQELVVGY